MLLRSRSLWEKVNYVITTTNVNLKREESINHDQLCFNCDKQLSHLKALNMNLKSTGIQQGLLLSNKYYFSYRSDENFIDFQKDYYEILGVDQKADFQQIKQKFYFLAKQYHPDKNKGHQTMFKTINQAYNILSQPKLRKQYDQNRNKFPQDKEGQGLDAPTTSSRPLSYQPYSQMRRSQWAVLRNGYMTQNRVDYANYKKTFNPQQDLQVRFKKAQQWHRNFRALTKEQVYEEIQFREKLQRKYFEDIYKQQQARQQFLEQKFKKIGDSIQKILGKKVRSAYDNLIKK